MQDVGTRWNSMYERLLELKHGTVLYTSEEQSTKHLSSITPAHWELMQNIVSILQPFEELSQEIPNGSACISAAISALKH